MDDEAFEFLKAILTSNSPSGFEAGAQNLWVERTRPFAQEIRKDVHGNAIAAVNPACPFKVMLAGHCDEVGLMVMSITDEGFLELGAVGCYDPVTAPGTAVQVIGRSGVVEGVVGKKAVYPGGEDEAKRISRIDELWVDIGAKDRAQAEELVRPGDPIATAPNFRMLSNRLFASKGIDDRIGSFVCSETLRLLRGREAKVGVWSVSTVQEEVGSRGAITSCFGIAPRVGIAIDVAHASDYPTTKEKFVGDVKLGGGPVLCRGANVNPPLGERLEALAAG